ncbi:MAG: hypothetical protein JNL32_16290, partial [Candidatus Kapabacteria bacterium]|nr:hypothetical protein [Candidatus Kapabacteria bacterium]
LPNADGTSGQVLRTDGAGNLSWATTSLQYFTEARNNTAPNATVPVHQFAASGTETNIDLALTPKGTGALTAQMADGTIAGGNKRGQYSLDLQRFRNAATQVGSGDYSTLVGGARNTTSGYGSSIIGGANNTASGGFSVVAGGEDNTAGGDHSAIPGGRGLTLSGQGSFGFLGGNSGANNMTITTTNTSVFGNTDLWLANNDNTPRSLRFYEQYNTAGAFPSGTNFVGFRAPNSIAADVTWTLPNADGTNGQVLQTNGSGTLSWTTPGSPVLTKYQTETTGSFGADVNNYAISTAATHYRISATSAINLTGIDATASGDGRMIILTNVSTFAITLKHQDAGSLSQNRFLFPGPSPADIVLAANGSVTLIYDTTSGAWRLLSNN